MENLALKIKISVLWLFWEVAALAMLILGFMEPGVIDQLRLGEIEGMKIGPELLLFFAILLLVPLVMAFLSLALKDSANRWANIILGIVYAGIGIVELATTANPSAYSILLEASKVVVTALIVWYAYKWPKEKA